MSTKEMEQLQSLLDKLSAKKCPIERKVSSTCDLDCPFYTSGSYGRECAIDIVSEGIK